MQPVQRCTCDNALPQLHGTILTAVTSKYVDTHWPVTFAYRLKKMCHPLLQILFESGRTITSSVTDLITKFIKIPLIQLSFRNETCEEHTRPSHYVLILCPRAKNTRPSHYVLILCPRAKNTRPSHYVFILRPRAKNTRPSHYVFILCPRAKNTRPSHYVFILRPRAKNTKPSHYVLILCPSVKKTRPSHYVFIVHTCAKNTHGLPIMCSPYTLVPERTIFPLCVHLMPFCQEHTTLPLCFHLSSCHVHTQSNFPNSL
jgi:hypothetical protein